MFLDARDLGGQYLSPTVIARERHSTRRAGAWGYWQACVEKASNLQPSDGRPVIGYKIVLSELTSDPGPAFLWGFFSNGTRRVGRPHPVSGPISKRDTDAQ
jgi:hypothetical protein